MPILKPAKKGRAKQVAFTVDSELLNKIDVYCKWAGIEKQSDFFIEAAKLVFKKDKDWKIYVKTKVGK